MESWEQLLGPESTLRGRQLLAHGRLFFTRAAMEVEGDLFKRVRWSGHELLTQPLLSLSSFSAISWQGRNKEVLMSSCSQEREVGGGSSALPGPYPTPGRVGLIWKKDPDQQDQNRCKKKKIGACVACAFMLWHMPVYPRTAFLSLLLHVASLVHLQCWVAR